MEKVEREGEVAVLISPGYGAGWSTWDRENRDTLLFDADIVNAVLAGDKAKVKEIAAAKCPDAYLGGSDDLVVKWVPKGRAFEVEEYDGAESLHLIGEHDYPVA